MCATLCNNVGLSFWGGFFFSSPKKKEEVGDFLRRSWGFPKKKLGIPFVHEPQNLEIALREVGDFQDDCATVRRLGNWGCSKKSKENKLVNRSSEKQSESVRANRASSKATKLFLRK